MERERKELSLEVGTLPHSLFRKKFSQVPRCIFRIYFQFSANLKQLDHLVETSMNCFPYFGLQRRPTPLTLEQAKNPSHACNGWMVPVLCLQMILVDAVCMTQWFRSGVSEHSVTQWDGNMATIWHKQTDKQTRERRWRVRAWNEIGQCFMLYIENGSDWISARNPTQSPLTMDNGKGLEMCNCSCRQHIVCWLALWTHPSYVRSKPTCINWICERTRKGLLTAFHLPCLAAARSVRYTKEPGISWLSGVPSVGV